MRSSILLTLTLAYGAYGCGPERVIGPTTGQSNPSSQIVEPNPSTQVVVPKPSQVVNIDIVGPGKPNAYLGSAPAYVVAPGETAQFRAIAKFADGSTQDVTSEAIWRSSNYNYLSAGDSGLFTGQKPGTATVIAEMPPLSAYVPTNRYLPTHDVVVLPQNTYVLAGQVFESRDPLATVDDAYLEVRSGPAAGQVSSTGFAGYRLYGLTGPTTVRVSKQGYQTQERTVTVTDHQLFDIDLPLAAARLDVSGTYTFVLTAGDDCGVGLGDGAVPEQARERRYTAVVKQSGPALSVELSGAVFTEPMPKNSLITGRIEPGRVLFDLTWWDANWDSGPPRIAERLPSGDVLIVTGTVAATVSDRRIAGALQGGLYVYPAGAVPHASGATAASCFSRTHKVVLSR